MAGGICRKIFLTSLRTVVENNDGDYFIFLVYYLRVTLRVLVSG